MILADRDIDHIIKSGKAFLVNPYNWFKIIRRRIETALTGEPAVAVSLHKEEEGSIFTEIRCALLEGIFKQTQFLHLVELEHSCFRVIKTVVKKPYVLVDIIKIP